MQTQKKRRPGSLPRKNIWENGMAFEQTGMV